MTIVVHWWVFPLLILAGGFYWAHRENQADQGGMFSGFAGGMVLILTLCVTVAFILGHYL